MSPKTPACYFISFMMIVGLLAPATAQNPPKSQIASRIVAVVDDSARATISRSTHPLARPNLDIGPLNGDTSLERMILVLGTSPEREHEVQTLLDSQQTKGSPNYHHWLTPEEFGQKFGPSPEDIQQVSNWLRQHGFTVGGVAKSGRWIEFSGTSTQVETAFQTQMRQYMIAGNLHIANATDISIPAALAPVVKGVATLHDFLKKPMISQFSPVRREQGELVRVTGPDFTTARGNHFLSPSDFATIYNLNSLLGTFNGAGQTIAIVARSNISPNDVSTFRQTFGLAPNTTNVILNGPDPGDVPGDDIEVILDTEWSGAVAPGATIDVVVSASTLISDGVDLSAMFIVDNNLAPIMSVSFGQCEAGLGGAGSTENMFFNNLWQQAAAQGISVFVSAGDDGAAGCDDPNDPTNKPASGGLAVSGLASTPFNTAVGGTEFNETVNGNTAANFWNVSNGGDFESAKGYIPEMVWNESCDSTTPSSPCAKQGTNLFAGSGGASIIYAKPSWQNPSIPGMPADGKRDLPDVSLTAAIHDGYLLCFQEDPNVACQVSNGVLQQAAVVGGTSASSPSFAGIMAIIDQKLGGARQGLANYVLYNLAANKENFSSCNSSNRTDPTVGTSCIFNDTTAGTNSVPSSFTPPTGFNATTGFDLASGLGSVDANNLATVWASTTFQGTVTSITTSMGATVNITHGQPITLTAQVQKSPSGSGPTGTVSFVTDKPGPQGGVVTVGAGTLVNGASSASFSAPFSNLPGGSYNLFAHYPGDGTFAASNSLGIPVNVARENSTVSLNATVLNVKGGTPPPLSAFPLGDANDIIVFDGIVTSASGNGFPSGNVNFLDGNSVIGTVPLNNRAVAEAANCVTPIACLTIGTHSITLSYSNGDNSFNSSGPSNAVSITIVPPFNFTAASTAQTIPSGGTATYNVTLNGLGGFSGQVSFTCAGAPSGATCSVSPNPATLSTTTTSVPLVVTVSNTTNARLTPHSLKGLPLVFAGVFVAGLLGLRRKPRQRLFLCLGILMIAGVTSCGGGGGGPRPPTSATLTVTGTSGATTNTISLSLTVTH